MPAIIRDLDDDAATIIMVDSNLQRETLLPSERAWAYRMKLEAVRRKAGRPSKENASQLDPDFDNRRSNVIVAEQAGESVKQLQRFIRLTELIPPLLDMVDERKIAFNPAVELSYLKPEEQVELLDAMESEQATPSLSQAQRLKKFSQEGHLSIDVMRAIMSEEKKSDLDRMAIGESITIVTDVNGVIETGWLEWGRYRIEETAAPEGFLLTGYSTEINAYENGKTYSFEVENEPMTGYIHLEKTDRMTGQPIAGVQFDIYDTFGNLAGTMTTNDDGIAISPPLHKGDYSVVEHANPTGYVHELVEMNATVLSDETTYMAADNQPIQGKIRITKKDQLTGDLLAGAEFTITRISGIPAHNGAGNGEVVAVITTNENGVAETPLLTYGTYQIKETVVPEHFVDNGFSVDVTISDDNLQTYEVVVENEPAKGWLKLTKTNSLDGHPIAGVTFNVYYYDDYGNGLACTMTTDENGDAVTPALRKGRYLVQEEDEPVGYVHDLAELTAIVNPDETTELSVTNEPIQGILRIRKLDELTGEALAGAEFTVTRISGLPSHNGEGDGEVVAVITTDAHGIAVTPLLPYGLYKVEETKVPPHFVDNDFSTEMVIDEENFCTYEIDVENEPTKGWLRLTKTDRENGNPIAGVVFDVYYADQYGQGLATTMVTDANGVAMSEPLRKGQYTVQERGATEGYVFEQVFLEATVHSDETTELTATNQPVLVQLKLYKRDVDEYSGNPADAPGTRGDGVLTGAEFQVLAAEDITDRQDNVIL